MAGKRKATAAEVAERRAKALRMRARGATLAEIQARVPGYGTTAAVSQDISRALAARRKAMTEAADEYVMLELERIEALERQAWAVMEKFHVTVSHGRVVEVKHPTEDRKIPVRDDGPTLQAIQVLRQLSESKRKLLGLDQPASVDLGGALEVTVVGVDVDKALR